MKWSLIRNEFIGLTAKSRGGTLDLVCVDENKRTFIVGMQLGYYKHFMQRAKFYAFHRFNTLVKKGDFQFDDLTPIYCIGLLAKNVFPQSKEYYHFARLKNQKGEELDDQITHIIIEISKFDKEETQITSDLDKLIYTMKNLEHIEGLDQLPKVLSEDWIKQAMTKVDQSKMTPEQRMQFEMVLAKNASIVYMMKEEKKQAVEEAQKAAQKIIQEAQKTAQEAQKTAQEAARKAREMAKNFRNLGVDISTIGKATGLSEKEIKAL